MSDTKEAKERLFTSLYDAHVDEIFRYVYYRLRNREEALDVVHVVFAKFWQYIETGKEVEYPKAFLYRSARNTLINAVRDRKENISLDELAEGGFEVAYQEEDREELERQAEVVRGLQDLDVQYREILLLRYVDGLKVKEIASLLNENENTVSVRIHRGLAQLKKIYGQN